MGQTTVRQPYLKNTFHNLLERIKSRPGNSNRLLKRSLRSLFNISCPSDALVRYRTRALRGHSGPETTSSFEVPMISDNHFQQYLLSLNDITTGTVRQCDLSMETLSPMLSSVNAAVCGFVLGAVMVGFVFFTRENRRDRRSSQLLTRQALADLSALDEKEIKELAGNLPAWLAFDEVERAGWLNKVVKAAWPYLDAATSKVIVNALDPILQSTRPSFLTSIEFEKFSFGSVPARIEGVKVYETASAEALEIDLQVFWAGDPDVVLKIKAAQDTLAVPVSLTEFECTFTLRLIFAPLIGVFPCFGALTISLTEDPNVNFDLRVVGGDITLLPGLAPLLRTYIQALIASFLVWPRCITVPIPGTGYSLPDSKGANSGLLHILVHSHDDITESYSRLALRLRWPGMSDMDISHEVSVNTSREGGFMNACELTLPVEDSLRQLLSIRWYVNSELPETQQDEFQPAFSARSLTGETSILLDDIKRQAIFSADGDIKDWGPITIAAELEPPPTTADVQKSLNLENQTSIYNKLQNWRSKFTFPVGYKRFEPSSKNDSNGIANIKGARIIQMTVRYQSLDSTQVFSPSGELNHQRLDCANEMRMVDGQFISSLNERNNIDPESQRKPVAYKKRSVVKSDRDPLQTSESQNAALHELQRISSLTLQVLDSMNQL